MERWGSEVFTESSHIPVNVELDPFEIHICHWTFFSVNPDVLKAGVRD
jgi:hypothetical protein